MSHLISLAPTGRAKCKSCKAPIQKGELRLGEAVPNAFGEGEARHWYHLSCGAERRPEAFQAAHAVLEDPLVERDELLRRSATGLEHPRWTRVVRVERASSGRARCRHCKELIEKGGLGLTLEIIEDGMANPAGFVHPSCMLGYGGTIEGLVERVARATPLENAERAELEQGLLSGTLSPKDP